MAIWRKYFAIEGLEVSKGGAVRRTYNDIRTWTGKGQPRMLDRKTGADGNLYVEIRKPVRKTLRIDELVAVCFLPPRENGQMLIHKDMDKGHCWADNLQWVSVYEFGERMTNDTTVNTPDGFRLVENDLYVSKDGRVKQDGVLLAIHDTMYDSDQDCDVAMSPHIFISGSSIHQKRIFVEELVAKAYLAPPTNLSSPALLHIDNDYMNCALDNLKWVENTSPEYTAFSKIAKEEKAKKTQELAN